ncbi:ATP-binding cassette domain-containing protein [Cryobacterium breve]|uniref:ATP-binding cassette domain-containing protein n=1 Tax=Cryobacterium breve TaxID=1259258 RepID=UPI00248D2D72|nr:ATP-binding cassette domain-containing protein [Cryobacterium breve]
MDDLSASYPAHGASDSFAALRGITLRVNPGEVLGVLGESGSGKSTLARVLSGSGGSAGSTDVRPEIIGGEATVLGLRLRGISRRKLARLTLEVGMLAQDAGQTLPATLNVGELVAEPVLERDARYQPAALSALVATMVDAVRLPLTVLTKYPYELSSGQRQRVALARSLVLGPALLIADEPLAGVDVTVRDAVVDLIGELQRERAFAAVVIRLRPRRAPTGGRPDRRDAPGCSRRPRHDRRGLCRPVASLRRRPGGGTHQGRTP